MALNTLVNSNPIAANGKKAFLEGSKIISSGLSWTPSGMLTRYLTNKTERDNPPTGKFVEIDGFKLAVFLRDRQPYVMDDVCPHAGASLSGGHVEVEPDGTVTRLRPIDTTSKLERLFT